MNVAFFIRHFNERGTEVAIYDYAKYNEEILGNKSYIICFTDEGQVKVNLPIVKHSYQKFADRFKIIEINDITEMKEVGEKYNLQYFYSLYHGGRDFYQFENKDIWKNIKTIKHCVYETWLKDTDYMFSISNYLNYRFNTNVPVLPHIIALPDVDTDLRESLSIPKNAIVLGRHGGFDQFNIQYVKDAIINTVQQNENLYFLFMNTEKFYTHPRIIYLDMSVDLEYKTKFINTCDVMIHAQYMGETFGLCVAEFSSRNKPVITNGDGWNKEHLLILGNKAIVYNNANELQNIFNNIKSIISSRNDWNAYSQYNPQNIMKMFDDYVFKNNTI